MLDNEGCNDVEISGEEPQDENRSSATPRRLPGRPRIERTGLRGRPPKLFHIGDADARSSEAEFTFLSEIPVKQAVSGLDSKE